MSICIVCDRDMLHDPNECPECGEPIHRTCLNTQGCPSCEILDHCAAVAEIAAKPVPSKRDVEPPAVPSQPKRVVEKNPIPTTPPRRARAVEIETKPGGEVIYEHGAFRIIRGVGCPMPGGIKMKVRATYKQDPEGFRGYGDTEKDALKDLEAYAFPQGQGS